MRAPYQILAIPYRNTAEGYVYCVLRRADSDVWQFPSGGGEDDESPGTSALREIREETGITAENIIELTAMCHIPTCHFKRSARRHWGDTVYTIPEYAFAFEAKADLILSHEHTEAVWLSYDKASARLTFDSNRTALYELDCRLRGIISAERNE